ncbi:MAG: alanine racemase [Roseinatronobacter sp.]
MAKAQLLIDLSALQANWRALDALSGPGTETGATVKADGYGLGAGRVAQALAAAGARRFFVALAEEGAAIRAALGAGPAIHVFGGHMAGDAATIAGADLIPMLNSAEQAARHLSSLPGHAYGVQLDTGMNRLGMEASDWAALRGDLLAGLCTMVMSHLACADEPDHPMNARQLAAFHAMTDGITIPRSLSATGGILLGRAYHFDITRPGIGLHGCRPFDTGAKPVRLSLPVVQVRDVGPGETVGYSNTFTANAPLRVATVAAGYADGILRTLSGKATLWHGATPCPLLGRVSMDLLTVDVTGLGHDPETLDLLGPHQDADQLADVAGTIGYEILTGLGARYARVYSD